MAKEEKYLQHLQKDRLHPKNTKLGARIDGRRLPDRSGKPDSSSCNPSGLLAKSSLECLPLHSRDQEIMGLPW